VEADGQTDREACITSLANADGNKLRHTATQAIMKQQLKLILHTTDNVVKPTAFYRNTKLIE